MSNGLMLGEDKISVQQASEVRTSNREPKSTRDQSIFALLDKSSIGVDPDSWAHYRLRDVGTSPGDRAAARVDCSTHMGGDVVLKRLATWP